MLFASSLTAAEASVADNKKALPDFIEGSIAMMYPNASESKLVRLEVYGLNK